MVTATLERPALARWSWWRLLWLPLVLLGANAFGFLYATMAKQANSNAPLHARSLLLGALRSYGHYVQGVRHLDFGTLPYGRGAVSAAVLEVLPNSLGLLALALLLSATLGLFLGLQSVPTNPPRVPAWLTLLSTVGLTAPAFYVGTLSFTLLVLCTLQQWPRPDLPFYGTGWDRHLVLPLIALCLRPTAQMMVLSAQLMADELRKPYVTAARSLGQSWLRARWRSALPNVAAPLILALLASLRLLVGELLVVEWIFGWRGIGRLLAEALVPPRLSTERARALFLEPELVAFLLLIVAFGFVLTELLGSLVVTRLDPRLRERA